MQDILQKLERLKKGIDSAKIETAEAEGGLKPLAAQLKDKFKIDDTKEAKQLLADSIKKRSDLEKTMQEKMGYMEKNYEW